MSPSIDPHLVAGATSGFLATMMLHPLDLVKTRFHVQEHGGRRLPHYAGMLDAVRKIIRLEGWRGLYGGLGPNVVGNTASWGVYMHMYNRSKDALHERGHTGSQLYIGAATVAGALTTLLLHPVFMVKTRMQLQMNTTAGAASQPLPSGLLPLAQRDNYASSLNAVRRMVQDEGVLALYRGIGPSMLLVSHGSIQFLAYEQLKDMLLLRRGGDSANVGGSRRGGGGGGGSSSSSSGDSSGDSGSPQLNANDLLIASTLSKVCAIICTYPYQVVRSCVQQRQVVGSDAVLYTSAGDTLKHIWRLEGAAGFYRGIWAHMLRSTPQATITLMIYEYALRVISVVRPSGGEYV